jgi:hypothetical protein
MTTTTHEVIPAPLVIPCPGSNQFIHEDHVDGNWVCLCPTCGAFATADPIPHSTVWMTVKAHRPRVHPELGVHGPDCRAAVTGECTCTPGPTADPPGLHVLGTQEDYDADLGRRAAEAAEFGPLGDDDPETGDVPEDGHWTDRYDTPAELEGLR